MKNICTSFVKTAQENRNKTAVTFKKKTWKSETWLQYSKKVSSLLYFYEQEKIDKQSTIAIMGETSYEWAICDFANLFATNISVPIYANNTDEDMLHILNDSSASILFIDSNEHYQKWLSIKDKCTSVKTVISFKKIEDDVLSLDEIFNQYVDLGEDVFLKLEQLARKIDLKDLATIVYTSGTTGKPKGVMLSHLQVYSEVKDVFALAKISDLDTSLTFLPFAHILARIELWGHAYAGFNMAFAESIEKLRQSFLYVKPTFVVGVPRIFEKIYNGVISQAEASPTRMKIFSWAKDVGSQVSQLTIEKKAIPWALSAQYKLAKKLVFNKLKQKLGGRVRFAISGGAPLSQEIAEFFHAAGLLILEGYGLTETTAGVTFNSPYEYRFGTVGKPIGDVEIKIADDGEILVKSDKVMMGYYNLPDKTKEAIQDGWYVTGDIGLITSDGFLKITDRKKDLIKTAGGKYVAPQKLENLLKLSKYVSNVLVHGEKRKYIVCLITLNFEAISDYAKEKGISYADVKHLANHEEIKSLIRQVVADTNHTLASYETIKNFAVLDHDFEIESGELTPSMKVRRKHCDKKYADLLDSLYSPDSGSI